MSTWIRLKKLHAFPKQCNFTLLGHAGAAPGMTIGVSLGSSTYNSFTSCFRFNRNYLTLPSYYFQSLGLDERKDFNNLEQESPTF